MVYAPHILQIYQSGKSVKDEETGAWTPGPSGWVDLCECRCDDNGAQKIIAINGSARVYNYHIVFDKQKHKFEIDEAIRAVDKETRELRGEGKVLKPASTNSLNYSEIYL